MNANITQAQEWIAQADAILIGASNGLSIAESYHILAHPIKSVASLPKYQRYTIEKERYVPNSTQLASKCLKLGVE